MVGLEGTSQPTQFQLPAVGWVPPTGSGSQDPIQPSPEHLQGWGSPTSVGSSVRAEVPSHQSRVRAMVISRSTRPSALQGGRGDDGAAPSPAAALPLARPGSRPGATPQPGFPPPSARSLPALPPTERSARSRAAPAMAAGGCRWRSCLEVVASRQGQRVQHFQQAEDILLTLLEHVHAEEPRFLVDYSRNLEAFEFVLCASEDAVVVEVPLRIDGDALRVRPCQPTDNGSTGHGQPGACSLEVPSVVTGVGDWTSTGSTGGMEQVRCLAPGKVLQRLKELLVSAIVQCQRRSLLQPGAYRSLRLHYPCLSQLLTHCAHTAAPPSQKRPQWGFKMAFGRELQPNRSIGKG